jgi:DNA-binding NarL/FixJ family response regulator
MAIRVFLADDHAVVRDGLRLLLERDGDIEVVGDATDGRQTARKVQRLKPDIVVMDITMPELNGIDATQQIHQTCPDTRVIILSVHAQAKTISRALQAGAMGYLLKEAAGKEVVDAVRTVYAGHRYLSHEISETVIDDYVKGGQTTLETNPIECLSPREREILQLVLEGKSSVQIAQTLFLSVKSVETYRSRVRKKLGVKNLLDLLKFAVKYNLTTLDPPP